jgi:integrase
MSSVKKEGLSIEHFFDVVARAQKRDWILMRILFETGCAINDLCHLKVIDYEEPKEHTAFHMLTFNNPSRSSVISESLGAELNRYIHVKGRAKQDFIFSQKPSKPLSGKRVEHVFFEIFAKDSSRIKPLDIRYLHIIHAALSGLSIDAISLQTGLGKQRILQILDKRNIHYRQSYSSFFENITFKEGKK